MVVTTSTAVVVDLGDGSKQFSYNILDDDVVVRTFTSHVGPHDNDPDSTQAIAREMEAQRLAYMNS